jgi:hypothetical protein
MSAAFARIRMLRRNASSQPAERYKKAAAVIVEYQAVGLDLCFIFRG